jgi:hypothetical protein
MKKLVLILLFIPLVSFGQEEVTVIQSKTSVSTNIENDLVLSEKSINVKVPFSADLSKYTTILLIDVSRFWNRDEFNYSSISDVLSLTVFEIKNPYDIDKKRFKKEPNFLKTIKKDSYLYLSYKEFTGRGDDKNSTLIIRDWKNKIIYNATHINTGLNEIFAPLIDY